MLKDQDNSLFCEKLKLIFLQMPLFRLAESELVTRKDQWFFFLKIWNRLTVFRPFFKTF
ncbi:MAG: Rpn family recombination-promoting nuclease/putative transposase [Planctomycetaceae bacterium]|jgi:hypothetical protein|nr:Rpn family recombination-promoting nuclease/putative transposase [Planctomycetaceae bacterium]